MDLVYDRFVKKFLADGSNKPDYMVFYRISEKDYISKKSFNSKPPETQEAIKKAIERWTQREKDYLDNKKQEKIALRQKFLDAIKKVGYFIDRKSVV